MINNEPKTCTNSEEKATQNQSSDSPSVLLSESKSSIKSNLCQPSNLETIPEISVLSEGDTESKSKKPNTSRHSTVIFRNRNDSIRQLTDKVLSISNDIFRSIENAHELIDLKHSNFSAATQTAAAHAALSHHNPTYDYGNHYALNHESLPNEMEEVLTEDRTGSRSSKNFHSQSETNSEKSLQMPRPIDEMNIDDTCTERRVNYENNFTTIKKDRSDEIDFRTRRRFIFKNGAKKSIPDDIHISILEVFIYLWGVIAFFADLISDIILSIDYFHSSRFWLAIMTLMFVIVPNFTLSLFSLSWYIDKYESERKLQEEKKKQLSNSNIVESHLPDTTCGSITFWIMTILFVVFQLDLVWKYIQGFIYTLKGWACRSLFHNLKWEKYYIEKQIKCDTDIGMLRLIDVFLDSGPQVLLQLYVITTQNLNEIGSANIVVFTFKDFQTTSIEIKQLVSILSSLFAMGFALAGYHRCLRNQQFIFSLETNKPLPRPMRWISTIMQFIWYVFLIAPRVLSMAIFASTFRSWFFMIIFIHWLIMYFWILNLKTNYCITSEEVYSAREHIFEKFYDLICSFIYIFVYFNLKAGPTRYRYLIYYSIFYSENILFCICYFLFSKEQNFAYKLTLLLIVVIGFWIAIAFQIVYYLHCHPSHNIQLCVKKSEKFHFVHKEILKPTDFYDLTESDLEEMEKKEKIFELHNAERPTDSAKSSSSSSINNENSASTMKLIRMAPNCETQITNQARKKEKKHIFRNNFTKFLNLYSSSDSVVVIRNEKKSNLADQIENKRNELDNLTCRKNSAEYFGAISPHSTNSSIDSFKSVVSFSDKNDEDKETDENEKTFSELSIEMLSPPLVSLNDIIDAENELYDNISNIMNKKCTLTNCKSLDSLSENEVFL